MTLKDFRNYVQIHLSSEELKDLKDAIDGRIIQITQISKEAATSRQYLELSELKMRLTTMGDNLKLIKKAPIKKH